MPVRQLATGAGGEAGVEVRDEALGHVGHDDAADDAGQEITAEASIDPQGPFGVLALTWKPPEGGVPKRAPTDPPETDAMANSFSLKPGWRPSSSSSATAVQ